MQRQPLNGCGTRERSDGQLTQFLAKTDHLGRHTSGGCCGKRRNIWWKRHPPDDRTGARTTLYWMNIRKTSKLEALMGMWPNSTGMVPCSPLPKLFKWFWLVALVGHGVNKGFQNATFKNPLLWHYKTQSFHIWYIASFRGPLPMLFKLCPWG